MRNKVTLTIIALSLLLAYTIPSFADSGWEGIDTRRLTDVEGTDEASEGEILIMGATGLYAPDTIDTSDLTDFDISSPADNDIIQYNNASGYWENEVPTPQLTEEEVEDYVGGMITGNTENGITVTYQDGDGTIDFDVTFMRDPVEDWWDISSGLPVAPTVGDRYISDGTDEGLGWYDGWIYEWDGDEWIEETPAEGWLVWMLMELMYYIYFSGGWMEMPTGDTLDDVCDNGSTTDQAITTGGLTVTTGTHITAGTTQWDNGSDKIDGEQIADNTIDEDALDFVSITLVDFTNDAGFLTSEVDGSITNEFNTIQGDDNTATTGLAISIDGAGIVTTDVVGDVLTITGTEVDGSTSNEINTITCPDSEVTAGLAITFADTGIMTITESADTITFDATEAQTLDNVSDLGATTNQALTTGGIIVGDGDTVGATTNKWLFDDTGGDVSTTGNVGIGTINPTERLEVAGDIKAETVISPILIGGKEEGDKIIYKSTLGIGGTTAHTWRGGNNPQYACDLNVSGWQRCADDSGTNNGGTYGVGKSLKAVGVGSGVGAGNDLVGFAAKLPGNRTTNGSFYNLGSYLHLWSSTESSSTLAWRRYIYSTYSTVYRSAFGKGRGFSVRCLRDTDDTSDFTDPRDGTVYPCVRIGTQVWMTKNLAYLPSVNAAADNSTDDPMYYVYGYDGTDVATAKALSNYTEYGVLYNHPAAIISAPTGFHVPSDEELNVLELATLEVIAETAGDDLMTILNDGNVGIGTTNPLNKLDVVGSSGNTNLRIYDSSANSESALKLQNDAKTWYLQNWGSGGNALRILNNAGTTVMLWDDDGNVGIGTTSPEEKLHVNGSLQFMNDNFIKFDDNAGGPQSILTYDSSNQLILQQPKATNFHIKIWDGSGVTDALVISDVNKNVGIGTDSSPDYKLDVQGTFHADGESSFDGNVGIGTTGPTAVLHLKAGTATAGTAPFKLTSGVVNTTAEAGALEWDGTDLWISF